MFFVTYFWIYMFELYYMLLCDEYQVWWNFINYSLYSFLIGQSYFTLIYWWRPTQLCGCYVQPARQRPSDGACVGVAGQRRWRCCWLGACLLGPTPVLEGFLGKSYGDGDASWAPLSLLGASFSPLALSSKGESSVLSRRVTVAPLASSPF